MSSIKNRRNNINILLFGYINMNAMDGSAVFMSSVTTMLSKNPNINIDLVLANPIRRDLLLQPLYELENVNIICPYDDGDLSEKEFPWKNRNRMSFQEAGEVIDYYWRKNDYDWFIIRGIEVANKLININPNIISNSMVYMTGITDSNQELTKSKMNEFEQLRELNAYILCQTEEMKEFLLTKLDSSLFEDKIIPLNPMVPDTVDEFEDIFVKKNKYNKLCYTGKFHKGWNSIPMIVGFKEILEEIPEATLEVAGDMFKPDKDNPHYVNDLKYLLNSTRNLTWYGALSREEARQLILSSDIGFTWRDPSMDTSLELSTKLLEYGTLGKAVVLNPTPMHKKIFGDDYPLYAETLDDYVRVVKEAMINPDIYEEAARKMFEGSKKFTFTQILNNLLPYLVKDKVIEFLKSKNIDISKAEFQQVLNSLKNEKYIKYDIDLEQKLVITKLNTPKSLIELLEDISKHGEIIEVKQIGDIIFISVDVNSNGFYENFYKNFKLDDIKNTIFDMRNSNTQFKKEIKTQSFRTIQPQNINNNQQSNDLAKNNREYMILQSKYNALANSKLGKIQLSYWRRKRKK